MMINISSLASSFPGQAWTPFPKGKNVFGLGDACIYQNDEKIFTLKRNFINSLKNT